MERNFEYDYSALKALIIRKCGTQAALAEYVEWAPSYLSQKLSGKVEFTRKDIMTLSIVLEIPPQKIGSYFFALKVQEGGLENGLNYEAISDIQ